MEDALVYDRLQFGFTLIFHYLFPQLTMGLALLIVYLKSRAWWTQAEHYNEAARFWIKVFALNYAFGVVTGIPMEFQFGTNWARFSELTGGVIGQTLAMEGLFAFFLESSFLGVLLFGEKKLGAFVHWMASVLLFLGSWLSGYFIIATNAWMQHPVAYTLTEQGLFQVSSLSGVLTNPWLVWQYAHNMSAAVATGSFVMAGVGAFYLLSNQHVEYARTFVRTGITAAAIASLLLVFPTGHENAKHVFKYQPVTGAAMEGLFQSERGAPMTLIGQPNMETMTIDNPIEVPWGLSILVYDELWAEVKGLDAFPRDEWPDNIPLLYYSYHIMAGLGTIFLGTMSLAFLLLWKGMLFRTKIALWAILLISPFPYIATTAGWMTAELGRQPWLVHGLLRTSEGISPLVHSGNALFTFIGFVGMYFLLGILFILLFVATINHGPGAQSGSEENLANESSR
ncbi:MAG: cytochrome ubiquinol oxidase subunit I [Nitrospirales bacterium]|nr:cytochrome ubiquinol oxidase subunit I [Nitrospira sp.]MDR4502021.1 cytochrome ubiquinol oxidase subunit I [Nitrospirales bacterium]